VRVLNLSVNSGRNESAVVLGISAAHSCRDRHAVQCPRRRAACRVAVASFGWRGLAAVARLVGDRRVGLSGVADAAEPEVGCPCVDGLGHACCWPISTAVVWRAEVGAALHDSTRDLDGAGCGIEAVLGMPSVRVFGHCSGCLRSSRGVGTSRCPLRDVAEEEPEQRRESGPPITRAASPFAGEDGNIALHHRGVRE
jgi:hypothetical protein